MTTRKTMTRSGPAPKGIPVWLTSALSAAVVGGLLAQKGAIPATVATLTHQNQIDDLFKTTRTLRGFSHTIMGGPDPGGARGLTVEMVFDATPPNTGYLDFVDAALKIINDAYNESPPRGYLGWISVRFQGRSRAYLSPQHSLDQGHRTATAEFAAFWRIPEINMKWNETPGLIDAIENKGREFGGIAHWGLSNLINSSDVIGAYARLDSWRRVRWHLTKSGTIRTFDSPFARRCGLLDPPLPALAGDYDGDGKDDFAIYRPSDGSWWFIDSSTGATRTFVFGGPGDIPVPGDYDGNGTTDVMVWNAYRATWRKMGGKKAKPVQWGRVGDIPVPADYSGDGKTDVAVWRPADGTWWSSTARRARPLPASGAWSAISPSRATTTATAGTSSRCGVPRRATGTSSTAARTVRGQLSSGARPATSRSRATTAVTAGPTWRYGDRLTARGTSSTAPAGAVAACAGVRPATSRSPAATTRQPDRLRSLAAQRRHVARLGHVTLTNVPSSGARSVTSPSSSGLANASDYLYNRTQVRSNSDAEGSTRAVRSAAHRRAASTRETQWSVVGAGGAQ